MLSHREKECLYEIIIAVIGDDQTIKAYKGGFNEKTVLIVEEMIEANTECNKNMEKLVESLLGTSTLFTRGWLRRLLKATTRKISKTEFEGYGCLASVKSRWKAAIISSTI